MNIQTVSKMMCNGPNKRFKKLRRNLPNAFYTKGLLKKIDLQSKHKVVTKIQTTLLPHLDLP